MRSRWTGRCVLLWFAGCAFVAICCAVFSAKQKVGTQDFRAFYGAGAMIRHCPSLLYQLPAQAQWQSAAGRAGYALPFYHPAYEALLYAPFSSLSYRAAYLLYAGWNMVLLWLCYLVSPPGESMFAGSRRPALLFLSFPLLLCIFVGQNSLLMLLVLCLVYRAIRADADVRAGVLLALITFKLATVVPLALLLTIRRGRRFFAGFAVTAAALIGLSMWLTGVGGTRDLVHLLAGATLAGNHSVDSQRHAAVWLHAMPNLAGLLYLCGSGHLGAHVAFAANLTLTLAILAGAVYIQRGAASEPIAFSTAVVCAVLVSPHLYVYDFAALVLPMLLLRSPWLKWVAVIWFSLPPILYGIGFLTWLAPAVVIPLLLLAICIAEFRAEPGSRPEEPSAGAAASTPAWVAVSTPQR